MPLPLSASHVGIIGIDDTVNAVAQRLRRRQVAVSALVPKGVRLTAPLRQCAVAARRSLQNLCTGLPLPRTLLFSSGAFDLQQQLAPLLAAGDLVVELNGGEFRAARRRAAALAALGIHHLDAAVFATPLSAELGFALAVGGSREAAARFAPLAWALAANPDLGFVHCGGSGSGCFVGAVQETLARTATAGLARGYELLSRDGPVLGPAQLAGLWSAGAETNRVLLELADGFLEEVDRDAESTLARNLATVIRMAARAARSYLDALGTAVPGAGPR